MNSWEKELNAAISFLEDQVNDLHALLRTTPPTELSSETCIALMGKALQVLIEGWRSVFTQLAEVSYPKENQ